MRSALLWMLQGISCAWYCRHCHGLLLLLLNLLLASCFLSALWSVWLL